MDLICNAYRLARSNGSAMTTIGEAIKVGKPHNLTNTDRQSMVEKLCQLQVTSRTHPLQEEEISTKERG